MVNLNKQSLQKQRGLSVTGAIGGLLFAWIFFYLAFQMVPAYIEFSKMNSIVTYVNANSMGKSLAEASTILRTQMAIEDISSIKAGDVKLTQTGAQVLVSFSYEKRIPLIANISLVLYFGGNAAGR